jgi:L-Ala-D/L-Glu epimerase
VTGLSTRHESWPIRGTFTISRGSKTAAEVVVVRLERGGHAGRGECVPYGRYGETVDSVMAQVESLRGALEADIDRVGLQRALPAGAARNALDCALWDLEAKTTGRGVAELAGVPAPRPLTTAYTLSVDTPERMREAALAHHRAPLLKLKLAGDGDMERVQAVRSGAPDARIIVDANEGWSIEEYVSYAPQLYRLGVTMIEQPFPADADEALEALSRPVPVCADESCHDRSSLEGLAGRYDMINIKLDKTGGLTEALALKRAGEERGFGIMVGCMLATSLAMAPALYLCNDAAVVDLDGPLLLERDRPEGLRIDETTIYPPQPELWG